MPALRLRLGRQTAEGFDVLVLEARAFLFTPALELRRFTEIEAVEEGTAVERRRRRPVLRGQCAAKLAEVGLDFRWIQPERIGAEDQVLRELLLQGIEELFQGMPGVLGRALRPEIADDLVAGEPAFTRAGEQGEQGQPAALGDRGRPPRESTSLRPPSTSSRSMGLREARKRASIAVSASVGREVPPGQAARCG